MDIIIGLLLVIVLLIAIVGNVIRIKRKNQASNMDNINNTIRVDIIKQENKKEVVSSRPIGYCPEALDFQDYHEKEIERWHAKIENAEMLGNEYENPDEQIAAFKKSILLCDEFEEYCCSYPGGSDYYDNNEADVKECIERDLQNYIDNEYETIKRDYDEAIVQKKLTSSIKTKVVKYISLNKGVMRKDIYAQFPADQQDLVLKTLNLLIADGRVNKYMQDKKLLFKLVEK